MNFVFKIEKDKPIPRSGSGVTKYPFAQMEVGDSFAVSAELRRRVVSAAHNWGVTHSKKFAVRRDGDGYRCWRIA